MRKFFATIMFCAMLLAGCGGGSDSPEDAGHVAVFFVSGHDTLFDGNSSKSYLQNTAGPDIVTALKSAGYSVETHYYADHQDVVDGYGGFNQLVSDLKFFRKNDKTKVVVIAHSHGGVWAHAAITQASQLTVDLLVDLDVSSYGWTFVAHDTLAIGGDPRNKYQGRYDVEDVVPNNVQTALEVRSGDHPPLIGFFLYEEYDEEWNIRPDGSTASLEKYLSSTNHTEVHQAGGTTMKYVNQWLINRLGGR